MAKNKKKKCDKSVFIEEESQMKAQEILDEFLPKETKNSNIELESTYDEETEPTVEVTGEGDKPELVNMEMREPNEQSIDDMMKGFLSINQAFVDISNAESDDEIKTVLESLDETDCRNLLMRLAQDRMYERGKTPDKMNIQKIDENIKRYIAVRYEDLRTELKANIELVGYKYRLIAGMIKNAIIEIDSYIVSVCEECYLNDFIDNYREFCSKQYEDVLKFLVCIRGVYDKEATTDYRMALAGRMDEYESSIKRYLVL